MITIHLAFQFLHVVQACEISAIPSAARLEAAHPAGCCLWRSHPWLCCADADKLLAFHSPGISPFCSSPNTAHPAQLCPFISCPEMSSRAGMKNPPSPQNSALTAPGKLALKENSHSDGGEIPNSHHFWTKSIKQTTQPLHP